MNIRPLQDRVLVRRAEEEKKICWWNYLNW